MAKKKSNRLLIILVAVVVVLIVFAVIGKKAGWIGKSKEIEVELGKVEKRSIIEKVSASGDVQPETEVKISPDVSGEIIELNINEGDSVIKGQLLIRIRPDNYISAVERAVASLNQQKANWLDAKARKLSSEASFERTKYEFDRARQLRDDNVISDADFQLAEANFKVAQNNLLSAEQNILAAEYIVKSAQATVNEAQENLRRTNVYAPISGTVSKLNVELGERVVGTEMMTGTEMLRIADLTKMEVQIDVNENDIIRVNVNDTADIDVDSYTYVGKKFKGLVTEIANTANDKPTPEAVTEFEVKVRILNESYADLLAGNSKSTPFRPGMTASVEIITDIKAGVIAVPISSVTTRSDKPKKEEDKEEDEEENSSQADNSTSQDSTSVADDVEVVFVNDNGKAKMVKVKTGISDYDNIEILKGLETGQEIVTGPFVVVSKRLNDGDLIKKAEVKKEKSKDEE